MSTPVAPDQRRAEHVEELLRALRAQLGQEDRTHRVADTGGLAGRDLTHRVARRDMADLVPKHRRQLGLGVEISHEAAGDVDVASRQREGVDVRAVEHGEPVDEIRSMAVLRQRAAQALDVGIEPGVVVDAELAPHVGVGLAPDRDLLGLRDHDEVGAAGDGIGGAAADGGADASAQQQRPQPSAPPSCAKPLRRSTRSRALAGRPVGRRRSAHALAQARARGEARVVAGAHVRRDGYGIGMSVTFFGTT